MSRAKTMEALVNVQLSRVTSATKLGRKLLSPLVQHNEYASKNHRPYPIRSTKHNLYTPTTRRQPYNELVQKRQIPPWSVTIGRILDFKQRINNIVTKNSTSFARYSTFNATNRISTKSRLDLLKLYVFLTHANPLRRLSTMARNRIRPDYRHDNGNRRDLLLR